MPKLHIIEGTQPPDTPAERVRARVRRTPKPDVMLECRRCGGREVIETRIGVLYRNGRATGGTKQYLCALCLSRGERVVLL